VLLAKLIFVDAVIFDPATGSVYQPANVYPVRDVEGSVPKVFPVVTDFDFFTFELSFGVEPPLALKEIVYDFAFQCAYNVCVPVIFTVVDEYTLLPPLDLVYQPRNE